MSGTALLLLRSLSLERISLLTERILLGTVAARSTLLVWAELLVAVDGETGTIVADDEMWRALDGSIGCDKVIVVTVVLQVEVRTLHNGTAHFTGLGASQLYNMQCIEYTIVQVSTNENHHTTTYA